MQCDGSRGSPGYLVRTCGIRSFDIRRGNKREETARGRILSLHFSEIYIFINEFRRKKHFERKSLFVSTSCTYIYISLNEYLLYIFVSILSVK